MIFSSHREVPLPFDTVERMEIENALLPLFLIFDWWMTFPVYGNYWIYSVFCFEHWPEIMYSVCVLARFNNNSTPLACYLCTHLLSFIAGSTEMGLIYLFAELKDPGFILHEPYSDADFAGERKTRRLTADHLVYLHGILN